MIMTTIIRFETMIKRNMSQNRLQTVSQSLPNLCHVFHHPRGVYRLRCCKFELEILSSIRSGGTNAMLMALVKLIRFFLHTKNQQKSV